MTPVAEVPELVQQPPSEQSLSVWQPNALQQAGLQQLQSGQYAASVSFFQRALRSQPRDAYNWYYLALNYQHQSELERCRQMLQRARAYTHHLSELSRELDLLSRQCQ